MPASTQAATTASPNFRKGPTQLTRSRARAATAASWPASPTSASSTPQARGAADPAPASASTTPATLAALRPAAASRRAGGATRSSSRSTCRPVKPVAPNTTTSHSRAPPCAFAPAAGDSELRNPMVEGLLHVLQQQAAAAQPSSSAPAPPWPAAVPGALPALFFWRQLTARSGCA